MLDATETGELLPLTGTEYVTGFESQADTGEPSAPAEAQPMNMQAVSVCFAIDHVDGDHTIDRPAAYEFWRGYQPDFRGDRMLSWRCPHPRTLEVVERSFTPNPETTRCSSRPTSGSIPATRTCGRSAGSPRGATSSTALTPVTSPWSTGR